MAVLRPRRQRPQMEDRLRLDGAGVLDPVPHTDGHQQRRAGLHRHWLTIYADDQLSAHDVEELLRVRVVVLRDELAGLQRQATHEARCGSRVPRAEQHPQVTAAAAVRRDLTRPGFGPAFLAHEIGSPCFLRAPRVPRALHPATFYGFEGSPRLLEGISKRP